MPIILSLLRIKNLALVEDLDTTSLLSRGRLYVDCFERAISGQNGHTTTFVSALKIVRFVHGDVRVLSDVEACGPFDLLIECSAEPSVHAGYGGSPDYVVQTNLMGTYNCLEAARRHLHQH